MAGDRRVPKAGAPSQTPGASYVRRARLLLLRRNAQQAIVLLRRGLAWEPDSEAGWLLLGKALVMAKRMSEAHDVLAQLTQRTDDPEAHALFERVRGALEQQDEAARLAGVGLDHELDEDAEELIATSRLPSVDDVTDVAPTLTGGFPDEDDDLAATLRIRADDMALMRRARQAGREAAVERFIKAADPVADRDARVDRGVFYSLVVEDGPPLPRDRAPDAGSLPKAAREKPGDR